MLLVDKLDFPDKQLPRDLVYGMGIVEEMETTNSLATRTTPSTTNAETLVANLESTNKTILTNLQKSKSSDLTKK